MVNVFFFCYAICLQFTSGYKKVNQNCITISWFLSHIKSTVHRYILTDWTDYFPKLIFRFLLCTLFIHADAYEGLLFFSYTTYRFHSQLCSLCPDLLHLQCSQFRSVSYRWSRVSHHMSDLPSFHSKGQKHSKTCNLFVDWVYWMDNLYILKSHVFFLLKCGKKNICLMDYSLLSLTFQCVLFTFNNPITIYCILCKKNDWNP